MGREAIVLPDFFSENDALRTNERPFHKGRGPKPPPAEARRFFINWYGSAHFRVKEKSVGSEENRVKHRNAPTHRERLSKGVAAKKALPSTMEGLPR